MSTLAPPHSRLGDILANAITHGIGAGLAVAGAICLIAASTRGSARVVTSCAIFSGSLILVYLCSTLYHSLVRTRARYVFHVLDHSSIYVLIAGTYTPFTVVSLGGRLGWTIAASHPDRVAALGGFHTGRMVTEEPDSPHLLAPRVRAEVYWGHADQDQSMTAENMATLDQAMNDAGVPHTTELFEGAQHGYTMSDMGAYNEVAAERHFAALFALLQRTLP